MKSFSRKKQNNANTSAELMKDDWTTNKKTNKQLPFLDQSSHPSQEILSFHNKSHFKIPNL